jgi:uncharacterized membrane-anchored protein
MFKRFLAASVLVSSSLLPAFAADSEPKQTSAQFEASLNYQQGTIDLPGGIATLNLPPSFRYLNPTDSERLLTKGWGNPPGNTTLGMIVPANVGVLSEAGWGVVVTYDADGHVKDDDAKDINYGELLTTMKESNADGNAERKKLGYGEMTLVGWAETPSYDAQAHKLYWAQEFKTGAGVNSLNYNIRVLGRQGVLVLNAVAGMNQIATIREEMKKVTAFSEFTAGNRYTDYNSATDKTAEYGIAALVAGGAAAKLGLFGKLFALLLAFKKLIFMGGAALVYGLFKFFSGRSEKKVNLDKA